MRVTSFLCAVILSLAPVAAFAGFQFVAPADKAPAIKATTDTAMPSVANEPVKTELLVESAPAAIGDEAVPLTPVVKESDSLVISDEPMTPAAPPAMPSMQRIESSDAASVMPAPAVPPMMDDGAPVQGFGRSVPLVMALQQIVPPNYRYSFGNGVPAGLRVNWTGGKPWKDVVADMAGKNDMNVEIVSNVIAFRRRSPMDIISAQAAASTPSDTVQGMELKPVAGAPVVPSPWIGGAQEVVLPPPVTQPATEQKVASAEPMKLLEKQTMDDAPVSVVPAAKPEMPADTPEIDAFSMPEEPAAPAATPAPEAKPVTTEKPKGFFDKLLDFGHPAQKMDTPLEDKKIEVADAETVKPAIPVTQMGDVSEDAKVEEAQNPAPAIVKWEDGTPKAMLAPEKAEEVIADVASLEPTTKNDVGNGDLSGVQEWQGQKGQTLRQTLTAWAQQAGVSMVWSSEYDYPLQTDVRIQGSYPDAVRTMLAGFAKAKPRPLARLFRNKSVGAQPVLVVETDRLAR